MDGATARRLWRVFEPVHDVVYFSPEPRAAADGVGMRGFWMGYTAFRAAPLGTVGPDPVTAAFHGFHPSLVARALPDAWDRATPDQVLRARAEGTAAALRRLWSAGRSGTAVAGDAVVTGDAVAEAADLAWSAAQATDVAGRMLAAANRAVPRPDDPVQALWQATTTLREHRGDGHVAVLVARGVGPVAAHLLKIASGESDADLLRTARRWPDDVWSATVDELRGRGWLDGDDRLTPAGAAERDEIERLTDEAATVPWTVLGDDDTRRLADLLTPLADAVAPELPPRNPVGMG